MRTLPLRARLTLWYTVALLVVLCLFSVNVLWQQKRVGTGRVDRELKALSATLESVVREELREMGDAGVAATEARNTVAAPGRAVAVLDANGRVLAAQWSGLEVSGPLPDGDTTPRVWSVGAGRNAWRVNTRPLTIGKTRLVLLVASPLSDLLREQHEVQEALLVAIPIVMLLAGAGGLWLASVGLRPITDMARRATRIPLTGLEDLGHPGRTDELGQLASAFNGLVARLRAALQTQRQFMADASHELRTPTAILRSEADLTLSRPHRSEDEYRASVAIMQDATRRLSRIVDDLFLLVRADSGNLVPQLEPLYAALAEATAP
jgi:two-component system OmpR family sensor kinase